MSEFLAMGGKAWYVWGSYVVCFSLLALEIFFLMKRSQKAKTSETSA